MLPGVALFRPGRCLAGFVKRMLGFRRHVVFVMFGQYLGCREGAIRIDPTMGYRPFSLLEQVGQDPGI
jgi:hypothetical protein